MLTSRVSLLFSLFLLLPLPLLAQWQVSTLVPGRAGIEDGLVMDKGGNLYVSQFDGSTVRKITPDGNVSVYASGFNAPNGLAIDDEGILYVTNAQGGRVSRVYPNGTVVRNFVAGLTNPTGVALNARQDTLYIAHYQLSRISRVALADSGNVETWVSGGLLNGPVGLFFDEFGTLHAGNFNNGDIIQITADGSMSRLASIPAFMGFAAYSHGTTYATSFTTNRIYRIDSEGTVERFAGSGNAGQQDGDAATATFNGPNGIVASPSGDTLYVSDYNAESLRMITNVTSTSLWEPTPELPNAPLQLDPSYPNPFSERTTITYHLATPTSVRLYISDVQGRTVRSLASSSTEPGTQTLEWDGRDDGGHLLPNGLYFYTTLAGDASATGTLILMR